MTETAKRIAAIADTLAPELQAKVLAFAQSLAARESASDGGTSARPMRLGFMKGDFWIADDFDGPLPAELQRYFDGVEDDPASDADIKP